MYLFQAHIRYEHDICLYSITYHMNLVNLNQFFCIRLPITDVMDDDLQNVEEEVVTYPHIKLTQGYYQQSVLRMICKMLTLKKPNGNYMYLLL
jgi:hypothetical protein